MPCGSRSHRSRRRLGQYVTFTIFDLIIVSFGIRTSRLSKVLIWIESSSTLSTAPVTSPTCTVSPRPNDFSVKRNRPEMMLDTEVCAAKPSATPAMPAAPSTAVMSTPALRSAIATTRKLPAYRMNFSSMAPERWCIARRVMRLVALSRILTTANPTTRVISTHAMVTSVSTRRTEPIAAAARSIIALSALSMLQL